jgi:FMN phosphatase YigB (HAD superfamily)
MKTIVWDVDDVLNDLMRAWFSEAWLPGHSRCPVAYEGLTENPPHVALGIPIQEYLHSLDEFRAARGGRLVPNPEVLEWFRLHGHRFRHIALTAVPYRIADVWAAWVIKHFGRWIRSFNFVPSPRVSDVLPLYDADKRDFLSWWQRGDIIVDDNPTHIAAAAELGIEALTFPRPWNGAQVSTSKLLESLGSLG